MEEMESGTGSLLYGKGHSGARHLGSLTSPPLCLHFAITGVTPRWQRSYSTCEKEMSRQMKAQDAKGEPIGLTG
jgi:hypothetical protein